MKGDLHVVNGRMMRRRLTLSGRAALLIAGALLVASPFLTSVSTHTGMTPYERSMARIRMQQKLLFWNSCFSFSFGAAIALLTAAHFTKEDPR